MLIPTTKASDLTLTSLNLSNVTPKAKGPIINKKRHQVYYDDEDEDEAAQFLYSQLITHWTPRVTNAVAEVMDDRGTPSEMTDIILSFVLPAHLLEKTNAEIAHAS
mmetsp:Transcript_5818/g.15771  ORF Transcript_5818/g.15771 Transcript_5818/m.15771 type:complete len:106 (-) Transcript_5818:711-1028(-)|eukprot:CAMPEP_0198119814 /NCGR_PEP_ID=MMETSP1442-20131203/27089_1 /TAXON_ID= /ORGANISM="Craspedostauros australis, Strain CCMP3328" /LENGTH=105 /DNA_ID=CAMNT_0043778359 /DNA_START=204 /DNA_END=521 /DNA_ORIENTATION=+